MDRSLVSDYHFFIFVGNVQKTFGWPKPFRFKKQNLVFIELMTCFHEFSKYESILIYIYLFFYFSGYPNSPSLQNVSRTSMWKEKSKSPSCGKENDEKILQKTQKRILFWPIFVGKITKKSYLMDAKNFGFTYLSNVAEIFF